MKETIGGMKTYKDELIKSMIIWQKNQILFLSDNKLDRGIVSTTILDVSKDKMIETVFEEFKWVCQSVKV